MNLYICDIRNGNLEESQVGNEMEQEMLLWVLRAEIVWVSHKAGNYDMWFGCEITVVMHRCS